MVRSSLWKRLGITVACMLLLVVSLPLTMQPKTAFADGEMISLNPTQGLPGTKVTVTGTGWNEHASRGIDVPIQISAPGFQMAQVADPIPDSNGNFSITFIVPANVPTGQLTVVAIIGNGGSADADFTIATNTPTVIVQKVFTADSNNKPRTTFAPGDPIRYMVEAQNTNSTPMTATVSYSATGPQQLYSWSGSASLASGPLRFYSAPTIPATTAAGIYTITVTITSNGQSSQGQSHFTVASPSDPPQGNTAIVGCILDSLFSVGHVLGANGRLFKILHYTKTGTEATLALKDIKNGEIDNAIVSILPGESCNEAVLKIFFPHQTYQNYLELVTGAVRAARQSLCAEVELLPQSGKGHKGGLLCSTP